MADNSNLPPPPSLTYAFLPSQHLNPTLQRTRRENRHDKDLKYLLLFLLRGETFFLLASLLFQLLRPMIWIHHLSDLFFVLAFCVFFFCCCLRLPDLIVNAKQNLSVRWVKCSLVILIFCLSQFLLLSFFTLVWRRRRQENVHPVIR